MILDLHPDPSPALVKAALWHDMHEIDIGDVPYQAKRASLLGDSLEDLEADWNINNGRYVYLDHDEKNWLRACDMLECALWARIMWHDVGATKYLEVEEAAVFALTEWDDCPVPVLRVVEKLGETR